MTYEFLGDWLLNNNKYVLFCEGYSADEKAALVSTYNGIKSAVTIAERKILTIVEIKAERSVFIDAEYERVNQLPISYLGNTFQADNKSTALMTSALAVLTSVGGTVGTSWWDIDNVPVAFTYAQFAGLGVAIFQRGQPYFANKRAKKDLINAATTIAEVEAIGW